MVQHTEEIIFIILEEIHIGKKLVCVDASNTLILALCASAPHGIILDPPFLPLLIYQQRTPMVGFRGQSKGIA